MGDFWDIKHRLCAAINAHDLPAVLSFYSPDAVYVSPMGVAEGHEQIAWFYEQFFKGFPDFHLTAWFEVADSENPAVTEWTITGTQTGPFHLPDGRHVDATGRPIVLRATCSTFIEEGKIKSHRDYYDQLELYTQLGFCLTEHRRLSA